VKAWARTRGEEKKPPAGKERATKVRGKTKSGKLPGKENGSKGNSYLG